MSGGRALVSAGLCPKNLRKGGLYLIFIISFHVKKTKATGGSSGSCDGLFFIFRIGWSLKGYGRECGNDGVPGAMQRHGRAVYYVHLFGAKRRLCPVGALAMAYGFKRA